MKSIFKKTCSAIVAVAGILLAPQASATILKFDEFSGFSYLGSYAGLKWDNFAVFNPVAYGLQNTGYSAGRVSEDNVVFNDNATSASVSAVGSENFNFNGAYLTGAWMDGLLVSVKGYSDGVLVYSKTVTTSAFSATYFDFNFFGIDQLTFSSSGGVNAGYDYFNAYQFAMDDFNITKVAAAVPEPASLALVAGGLMAIGITRRRSRRT